MPLKCMRTYYYTWQMSYKSKIYIVETLKKCLNFVFKRYNSYYKIQKVYVFNILII